MPTVDASVMRSANKRTVLSLLYQKQTLSRAEISRVTGLNRATVSSLVDELIAEEFVEETGVGTSSGGRKPILLQFKVDTGFVIGIDVQITHLTTVLINAARQILYERRRNLLSEEQPVDAEALTQMLVEEIYLAKRACPPSPHGLMGVGIGLPGMVNHEQGRALYLPNMGIVNWLVRDALQHHLALPVFVDNDANCGAWAQYLATRLPNLVFINAGIGLGVGLIMHGQLYRGTHGIAGEAGHHTIRAAEDRCSCGNLGCWEQYSSENGLARALARQGVAVPWPLPADFVSQTVAAAETGSAAHRRAFQELAEALGVGLVNILNIFNPTATYLGGTLAEAHEWILPEAHAVIAERALMANRQMTVTPVPNNTVALGAAGLALAQSIDLLPAQI
ncbi:MAG: ROK family transcriptional regulator [Firmicutes bacterium]|nr:ROK family transcriptional regulator [Bacillota bacterium]